MVKSSSADGVIFGVDGQISMVKSSNFDGQILIVKSSTVAGQILMVESSACCHNS